MTLFFSERNCGTRRRPGFDDRKRRSAIRSCPRSSPPVASSTYFSFTRGGALGCNRDGDRTRRLDSSSTSYGLIFPLSHTGRDLAVRPGHCLAATRPPRSMMRPRPSRKYSSSCIRSRCPMNLSPILGRCSERRGAAGDSDSSCVMAPCRAVSRACRRSGPRRRRTPPSSRPSRRLLQMMFAAPPGTPATRRAGQERVRGLRVGLVEVSPSMLHLVFPDAGGGGASTTTLGRWS